MAVVTHADEQSATFGVGKGRHRLGELASISNLVLEVLMLMLAFANQTKEVMPVVCDYVMRWPCLCQNGEGWFLIDVYSVILHAGRSALFCSWQIFQSGDGLLRAEVDDEEVG